MLKPSFLRGRAGNGGDRCRCPTTKKQARRLQPCRGGSTTRHLRAEVTETALSCVVPLMYCLLLKSCTLVVRSPIVANPSLAFANALELRPQSTALAEPAYQRQKSTAKETRKETPGSAIMTGERARGLRPRLSVRSARWSMTIENWAHTSVMGHLDNREPNGRWPRAIKTREASVRSPLMHSWVR